MKLKGVLTGVLVFVLTPSVAFAALININTADVDTLDTLPGIGPTYAQRIVEYREQHGPFAQKEDLQDVNGIGAATYADLADLITVGDVHGGTGTTTATTTATTTTTTDPTFTPHVSPVITFKTVTVAPPPDIHVRVPASVETTTGSLVRFEAEVYDAQGRVVHDATFSWTLGDGAMQSGSTVVHRYFHAGVHTVVVRAEVAGLYDEARIRVSVYEPKVALIIDDVGMWVGIENLSEYELDVSSWRIQSGYQYFIIPERTVVEAGQVVRFDRSVTKLTTLLATDGVFLYLPVNGGIIARGETEDPASAAVAEAGEKEQSTASSTPLVTAVSISDSLPASSPQKVAAPVSAKTRPGIVGTRISAASATTAEPVTQDDVQEPAHVTVSTTTQFAAAAAANDSGSTSSNILWYGALGGIMGLAVVGTLVIRRSQRNDWEITEE